MKQFVLAAAVALFATSVSAQAFRKYKISFRTNPNIGWMVPQNNNQEFTGSSLRFGFGLSTDILFTENYAIGTGLNVEGMGGKLKYLTRKIEFAGEPNEDEYIVERERNFNLRYVEIPVTLKLRTNEIGYITYWGQFGLGLGVNWRANADETDNYLQVWDEDAGSNGDFIETTKADFNDEAIDVSDEINILRASLIIGAGVEYNLSGTTSMVVGLTFNNGFTNVFNRNAMGIERRPEDNEPLFDSNGLSESRLKSTNNTIGLTLGILF